jgi:hypothetical protein
MNGKDYKEILLSFPGDRQQRIAESSETIKEEIYKSGEVPGEFTSTSYRHQPFEALVSSMNRSTEALLKDVRNGVIAGSLGPTDIEFLLDDVLKRLQDQLNYIRASIEVYKQVKPDESSSKLLRKNKRF